VLSFRMCKGECCERSCEAESDEGLHGDNRLREDEKKCVGEAGLK
jgi:hypothetical protein